MNCTSASPFIRIFLFALMLKLSAGCECLNTICEDQIQFRIIDKVTKQDLVFGTSPKYKVDSLYFKQRPDTALSSGYYSSVFVYLQTSLISNTIPYDTIYLRLTVNDIDTIILTRKNEGSSKCCPNGYKRIMNIKFNGTYVTSEGRNFLFEK